MRGIAALFVELSEEDVDYYTKKFEQTGFTSGINYYRCFDLNWELEAPWHGDLDLVFSIPGVKEYINGGGFVGGSCGD
ncbi:hypothetical protein LXL04_009235 [Taraxacum kok-saghyz]